MGGVREPDGSGGVGRMVADDTTIEDWVRLVQAEYIEIPGLHLTKPQVQRLWGLDAATCDSLLHMLENTRFLRRTAKNAYVRADF
jgi:hypothetical protein